ncbi:MAG: hypothetical protein D3910_26720, partial [Candidatus Electrothrix sp. ATG2]|nr:hypothetical protein [Candidatus Electrothrix sp. ATG2]
MGNIDEKILSKMTKAELVLWIKENTFFFSGELDEIWLLEHRHEQAAVHTKQLTDDKQELLREVDFDYRIEILNKIEACSDPVETCNLFENLVARTQART